MTNKRRTLLRSGLAGIAGAAAGARVHAQQDFPAGPMRIVVPTPPGGGNDAICRTFAQKLTERWGQPVVVENRTGANGVIAAQAVARSAPDGLTLLYTNSNVLSALVVTANPGYKLADLTPVSWVCDIPMAIGARRSLGVGSLAQLVALAKSRPGKLSYASAGAGGSTNFLGELLKAETGTAIVHIPYRGEAPAVQDAVAGEVDLVIATIGSISKFPDKLVALGVAGERRFPAYPDVPTLREQGFAAIDLPGWGGLFGPAGMPAPIVAKLSDEFARMVAMPDVARRMMDFGFAPIGYPPDRFAAMMSDHLGRFQKVVAQGRIRIE